MKNGVAPEPIRILLSEGNSANVDLMKYALENEQLRYELRTLQDGAEATQRSLCLPSPFA